MNAKQLADMKSVRERLARMQDQEQRRLYQSVITRTVVEILRRPCPAPAPAAGGAIAQ